MKNIKLLILLFGALGVVGYVAPLDEASLFKLNLDADALTAILMLAAYGVPTLMALIGVMKPPFQAWQAVASLAGFVLAAVKARIWETLPHIADPGWSNRLMIVATIGGVLFSVLAVAKPEDKA